MCFHAHGQAEYEKSIKKIGGFTTVEGFWQMYNHLVRPNDVPHTTDYHLFREGNPTSSSRINLSFVFVSCGFDLWHRCRDQTDLGRPGQ